VARISARRVALAALRTWRTRKQFADAIISNALSETTLQPADRAFALELVYGVFTPQSIGFFQQVIGRMQRDGCDAVVLGCTEIPLIMSDANSPLPTLDSTRLLARAALRRAAGTAPA